MGWIKTFHVIVVVIVTLCCLIAARSLQSNLLVYYLAWLVYASLLCGLMLNNLWCARLLIIPPLLFVLYTTPFVLYNFYAFISGDPLYLDSPASILIVSTPALFVTLPSTLVLAAYWNQRQHIFGGR